MVERQRLIDLALENATAPQNVQRLAQLLVISQQHLTGIRLLLGYAGKHILQAPLCKNLLFKFPIF
jgi:hypothetical protein